MMQHLNGKTIHKNKQVEFMGIKAKVRSLTNQQGNQIVKGIVIIKVTKVNFFTKSCQIYIYVELSSEMFSFDDDGFQYTEKCYFFLKSYFERCLR